MPSSGIAVPKELKDRFEDFKKSGKTWMRFCISGKEWQIADEGKDVEELIDALKASEKQCCLAFAYIDYVTDDGRNTQKPIGIQWIPECCGIKDKMLFSSSTATLKATLSLNRSVQVSSADELQMSELIAEAKRK